MSRTMNLALGVEMVMFRRHFVVARLVQSVVVEPA